MSGCKREKETHTERDTDREKETHREKDTKKDTDGVREWEDERPRTMVRGMRRTSMPRGGVLLFSSAAAMNASTMPSGKCSRRSGTESRSLHDEIDR